MTEDNPLESLARLLRQFITGENREQIFVRDDIGGLLETAFPGGEGFPDRDLYEELEIAVACYRPGGSQFMYDEKQVAALFTSALSRLGIREG